MFATGRSCPGFGPPRGRSSRAGARVDGVRGRASTGERRLVALRDGAQHPGGPVRLHGPGQSQFEDGGVGEVHARARGAHISGSDRARFSCAAHQLLPWRRTRPQQLAHVPSCLCCVPEVRGRITCDARCGSHHQTPAARVRPVHARPGHRGLPRPEPHRRIHDPELDRSAQFSLRGGDGRLQRATVGPSRLRWKLRLSWTSGPVALRRRAGRRPHPARTSERRSPRL
jgi:hypothetical protein